ncbi:hypothetical protein JCM21738_3664 [Mesobacillus boroniphilus JCM 21738]|uniref:Uncharacterized protein n=1 Tax=Mesobacillus boroniphilus JCM 21738 TaxID=1294265 RepID=W4RS91_9BACI|nr:hypothetical protein JCM21738_3664 [Mesobacillus boroniphilus JCM 21738]
MNGPVKLGFDFLSRRFAFRGAGGELLAAVGACGVSPVQLIPQESSRLPLQSTVLKNNNNLML